MENSVQDKNTEELFEWYMDMIENYPNTFIHYLSEDALLQWFGRSIRGPDRISYFIKTNMRGTKHNIYLQNQSRKQLINKNTILPEIPINGQSSKPTDIKTTPDSNVLPVFIERDDFACGDGPNIDKIPPKRKTEIGQGDCSQNKLNFFEIKGAIEFSKACYKQGVPEMKWERPCSLKIGCFGSLTNPLDFTIKVIIYGDNMPCKKNLLPEFEKCQDEDDMN